MDVPKAWISNVPFGESGPTTFNGRSARLGSTMMMARLPPTSVRWLVRMCSSHGHGMTWAMGMDYGHGTVQGGYDIASVHLYS